MDKPTTKLLRFADLRAANIVTNWPQLRRLQERAGFPKGFLLSPAVRVWDEGEVEVWVDGRRGAQRPRSGDVERMVA